MLARTAAGVLSNRLDTEVKIRTFYVKPDLRVHAEEIQINDRKHLPMFYIGLFDAKLSLRDITDEMRVRNMCLDDVLVNIVTYENEYTSNIAELFSSSKEDEEKDKLDLNVYLDKLDISRGHIVVWNQNKDKPEKESMDYSHLDIDSVFLSLKNLSYNGDTIRGYINHLSCSDKSGFDVDEFSSKSSFMVSSHTIDFKNLNVKTHATNLDLDLKFLYNGYSSYKKFVDSIMIIANIRPSQLTLSDLRYFSPTMGKMTDTLQIKGLITGFVRDFTASNFSFSFKDSTDFMGTIKMRGLPNFHETHIVGNVEKMNFTYQDISEFAIPTSNRKIPLPEMLSSVKDAALSGEFYGFHNNFNTKFNLRTNLGNVFFNGALNNDLFIVPHPYYFFTMHANNLDVGEILGMDKDVMLSVLMDVTGEGLTKKDLDAEFMLNIEKLKLFNNDYNDIYVKGDMENQRLIASTNVDSDLIKLDLDALLDFSKNVPSFDVDLDIKDANLYGLGLYEKDKKTLLSTNVDANLRGNDIDKAYGSVLLTNTSLHDSRGIYTMDSLNLTLTENYFNSKDVSIQCDFFDMNVNGIFNFRNIDNTFKNYLLNHFHIGKWTDRGMKLTDEVQDFYVNMSFKDTETLTRLMLPALKISDNTFFTATFTSNDYQLNSTLESDTIMYNDIVFNDIYLKNKTEKNRTTANINMKEIVLRESTKKNPVKLSLENLYLGFDVHNDSLLIDLSWDDDALEDRNKADIDASFVYEKNGGLLNLSSSDIIINDSVWNISPKCYVYFMKDKISFENFDVYSKSQSVNVNGALPKSSSDTLLLDFNKLNISDFDLLTTGLGIDMDGIVDGELKISGIKDKFTFLSNLDIYDLGFNKHLIGDAYVDASWNSPDTSIFVDAEVIKADTKDKIMTLVGKYYTTRKDDNLDFNLDMNGINISPANIFTKGILSRVDGELGGELSIGGSLGKPIIRGNAELVNAACNIDYLNTYYRINPTEVQTDNKHTIRFFENKIEIKDLLLVDTLNSEAVANATITHDYLRNFRFNVEATLDNFMGMNMLADNNSSFYGMVVASGDLKINGPIDDIVMDIDALSMPGTAIDIVLTNASSINDNFIVFVHKDSERDSVVTVIPENKKNNKFTLNLNANVTEDASVNIHLPSNMGNISAVGGGNMRLGVASGQLSLYGDYVISDGTFNFNFENLVRRNFDIKRGGTISWTGRADDADISVVGSYRTKSSISSLGIEADTTSMVNNINVDCILRLQEKLTNPTITFGLSLPNSTDDVKNMVFSIIDTTNQAVMSQQIISLLVLGSFSYVNSSLYSIGATNYYNVLTSSLSSWLSQISKDFDVGVRYTPEDNLTAEELEVALSTQLFDDKLTIEGNFGMYTGSGNELVGGRTNNIVGDFDITYKFTNRLSLKIYNHSNFNTNYYSYSYEAYSDYTQGIGISYSQSFDSIKEIFVRNRNKKNKNSKK